MFDDVLQEVCVDFISKAEDWDLSDAVRVKSLLKVLTLNAIHRIWHEHTRTMPEKLREVACYVRERNQRNEKFASKQCDMEILKRCMTGLSTKDRELLELYYFEDKSSKEIARSRDMTEDSVRRDLSYVREKLRRLVRKMMGGQND